MYTWCSQTSSVQWKRTVCRTVAWQAGVFAEFVWETHFARFIHRLRTSPGRNLCSVLQTGRLIRNLQHPRDSQNHHRCDQNACACRRPWHGFFLGIREEGDRTAYLCAEDFEPHLYTDIAEALLRKGGRAEIRPLERKSVLWQAQGNHYQCAHTHKAFLAGKCKKRPYCLGGGSAEQEV